MTIVPVVLCGAAILLPFIMGVRMSMSYSNTWFPQFAGLMTLKPLLATPIWLLICSATSVISGVGILLTLIPGIGLTLWIGWAYRSLLKDENTRQAAIWLYVLDAVRWINSFLILIASGTYVRIAPLSSGVSGNFAFVGIVLPSIFALVANNLAQRVEKPKVKPKNDDKPKQETLDS